MNELSSILSDEGNEPAVESAPVEAVEPIQTETPAAEATGEEVAATPAEAPKETNDTARGLQAAVVAERQKRQAVEARLRQLQQAQQGTQQPADGAPDPAQYQDNPQEYWRLLARHEARQELANAVQQSQQAQAQHAETERVAQVQDRLNAAVFIGQSKFKDFDAVINGGLAPFLSDAMREEIAESEHGPEVAYWLGKNPAEAQRLSVLSPRALAREVVKLEAKVVAPPKPVLPRTLTQDRDSRGQFANAAAYDGPTPLDAVLGRK